MAGKDVVGQAVYETAVDASGVEKGLRDAERKIRQTGKATEDAFARQGTQAVGKFQSALNKLFGTSADFRRQGGIGGAILGGFGLGAGLGAFGMVQNAVGKALDLMGDAVTAASDLAESQSKVGVVFAESAQEIEAWSDTSAEAMGLSKQAALEAAGTFGNLFDALGLTNEATTKMSKGAVQLAADLASFNNADADEVLLAIRSGLLGEAEPMRKFGSALTAARVETYALAQGWVKNKKDLTEAMKVQARYELILQDTVNAQGDYARTADGAANSARTLAAQQENLTAKFGQLLAGPHQMFLDFMSDLVDAVDGPDGATGALARMQAEVEKTSAVMAAAEGPRKTFREIVDSLEQEARAASLRRGNTQILDFIKGYTFVGQMLGNTPDQLADVADSYKKAGKTIDEFHRDLIANLEKDGAQVLAERLGVSVDKVNEMVAARLAAGAPDIQSALTDLWGQLIEGTLSESIAKSKAQDAFSQVFSWGWWNEAKDTADEIPDVLDEVGKAAQAMWVDTDRSFNALKGSYTRAVKDAEAFDKAWRFALANPDKGEKTANQIRDQMKTAMRRRNRALREGNEEAFAVADAEVKRLQKKLDSLEQREYEIKIQMRILGYQQAKTKIRGITHSDLLEITDDRPGNNARGTRNWRGGWTWVGEEGRELVRLPRGSQVLSNPESEAAVRQSSRVDIYVHDSDGGLARAGISTAGLASHLRGAIASPDQMNRRWEYP